MATPVTLIKSSKFTNVDNTSDVDKPVSNPQAAAIAAETSARIAGDARLEIYDAFDSNTWASVVADSSGFIKSGVRVDGVSVPYIKAKPLSRYRYQCSYVPFYGQSLSVGGSGYPAVSTAASATDQMFVRGMRPEDDYNTLTSAEWYASLVPALESISPRYATQGETPARGFADAFREFMAVEDGLTAANNSYRFMLSAPGQGGIEIIKLLRGNGTGYYERIIAQMQALVSLKAGVETVGLESMPWIHGERDYLLATTKAAYKTRLATLCADITADATAQMGQAHPVQVLGTQVASHITNNNQVEAQIALAQAESAAEISNFNLVCPMYFFPYRGPDVHLTATGYAWLGAYLALAHKRINVDQVPWVHVAPNNYVTQSNIIEITFDIPEVDGITNGLVWDTTTVPLQPNYGFRLFNSGGTAQTISSVTIIGRNRVRIAAANPVTAGSYIDYARQGDTVKGLGNLRDKAGDVLRGQTRYFDFPLHNWAIITKSEALL